MMMNETLHPHEPVPTFTRARLRFYSAACGVMIACIVYVYALWLAAL
jgi:hypothetical protein